MIRLDCDLDSFGKVEMNLAFAYYVREAFGNFDGSSLNALIVEKA